MTERPNNNNLEQRKQVASLRGTIQALDSLRFNWRNPQDITQTRIVSHAWLGWLSTNAGAIFSGADQLEISPGRIIKSARYDNNENHRRITLTEVLNWFENNR